MAGLKRLIQPAVAGVVLTLLSGLANSTPSFLVGASWYGWPATWIRELTLPPQYNPWAISLGGLIMDFVFWFIVSLIVLYAIALFTAKKPRKTRRKR